MNYVDIILPFIIYVGYLLYLVWSGPSLYNATSCIYNLIIISVSSFEVYNAAKIRGKLDIANLTLLLILLILTHMQPSIHLSLLWVDEFV